MYLVEVTDTNEIITLNSIPVNHIIKDIKCNSMGMFHIYK